MRKAILGAVLLMTVSGSAQGGLIGPAAINRSVLDLATEITFINYTQTITQAGVIDFWQIYNQTIDSQTARMQVFRMTGTGYQLIGENDLTVGAGFNQVSVPLADQISVQVNDLIGFRYDAARFIPYDLNTAVTTIWTDWPRGDLDVAVGDTIPFVEWVAVHPYNEDRTYSFAANVVPAGGSVPDPGSTLLLLGMGLVGLRMWTMRLH